MFIRLGLIGLLAAAIWIRWDTYPSILPQGWTPEDRVRITAPILELPEYTDSHTIIREGRWEIRIPGYAEIIPGQMVSLTGKVEPKVLSGKQVKIVMTDPTFEWRERAPQSGGRMGEGVIIGLGKWREQWVAILEKSLPEPMSSLAAGILLGVKRQMPGQFYQQLVNTGTLHIVAASGFNVMIVAAVLMGICQRLWRRGVAIAMGVAGVWLYVLLAGAGAAVVRAGIMGSLTLIAYYWGRPTEARRLLWITVAAMLLWDPLWIVDVGWQLSVAATAGLLYFQPWLERKFQIPSTNHQTNPNDQNSNKLNGVQSFVGRYLYPTLAASVATAPIIAWHFGRVSWISPLVNLLVLPLVPLIMLLSALVVGVATLLGFAPAWSVGVVQVFAWMAYVPLWWVVRIIQTFGELR